MNKEVEWHVRKCVQARPRNLSWIRRDEMAKKGIRSKMDWGSERGQRIIGVGSLELMD